MNTATIDLREMLAYSRYLIMLGQMGGNLMIDGHKPSDEELRNGEMCRSMCEKLYEELQDCNPGEIAELLECYDILHRMGYRKAPEPKFLRGCRQRMFGAWKGGDRNVEESRIFAMAVSSGDKEMKDTLLDKWVKTLTKYGHFPDTTTHENYQRLSLIMREKLDRYFGTNADDMKRRWAAHNTVTDLSTLGTRMLQSYRRFASSLYPTVVDDFEEKVELDNRILTELINRHDLSHYDREAYRLALNYNRTLLDD